MHLFMPSLWLFSAYFTLTVVVSVSSESNNDRSSKHFSLFSVVTFQNSQCTSDTSVAGGATDGTCYTSTECSDKGGTKSGNCASGFGVCCVFLNTAAAAANSITENRTRLRNSEFPSTTTATAVTTIAYTINKMQSDICQLRLDFTTFVIAGPSGTLENIVAATGTNCQDTLQIITTDVAAWSSTNTATLCGKLTGEHLYVDLSMTSTDTATITLVTAVAPIPSVALRSWDIKVAQIQCHATYRAPLGCHRFFTSEYGQIISYNFATVGTTAAGLALQNAGIELPLQRINTCIRRSKNMCCVEYKVCAIYDGTALVDTIQTASAATAGDGSVINEGFSIDIMTSPYVINAINANIGMIDSQCTGDYVEIPSSWSTSCGAGSSGGRNSINTRFCGARFGGNGMAALATTTSTPVCDCSEPFIVRHNSDDVGDLGGSAAIAIDHVATAAALNRGFCLDFKQLPCWQ